jgi:peptide/nickel transport system ATP-binding protein
VTHDLAVVSELAHRVAVMYAGRIVESGTRDEIFRAPAHPYTRALIDAIPRIGARRELRGIPGRAPSLTGRPNGCRFHDRCPLVEPACIAAEPPLIEVEPDHLSRCLRAAEVRAMPVAVRSVSDQQTVPTGAPVLSVEGLNSSYAGIEVLRDIDLTVGANECVALVGESGSGKSTLSRCIAGIHDEWNGRVAWGSYELSRSARQRDQKQRKAIQYIFQNPYLSLNPRMTIGQTIRRPLEVFGLAHGKDAHRRVLELMDQVSLAHSAMGVFPDRLSGGERQRVAIARALACEPEVLICDEVTSALDVSVQASIVSLLDDLRRDRNLAMLFVTHNLALVRSLADRTLVLRNGCIIEQGATSAVLDDPQDEYTKRLRADTPSMEDA